MRLWLMVEGGRGVGRRLGIDEMRLRVFVDGKWLLTMSWYCRRKDYVAIFEILLAISNCIRCCCSLQSLIFQAVQLRRAQLSVIR